MIYFHNYNYIYIYIYLYISVFISIATVTIIDSPFFTFGVPATINVYENATSVQVPVTAHRTSLSTISVDYTTMPATATSGSDFALTSVYIYISPFAWHISQ